MMWSWVLWAAAQAAPSPAASALIDVATTLPVRVELKYATTDNFMHKNVYGDWRKCLLVGDAHRMLEAAHRILLQRDKSLTFVMYDCARPRSVQLIMWDAVKGTPQQGYVADPNSKTGSMHNTGCAVDISLFDVDKNAPLDMGTPYDFFGKKAEPRHEHEQWKTGQLSAEAWANRLLLREVMLRAGFRPLGHEWWHFDCADGKTARSKYAVIP
jgi:zinc D-Ala-D-Ala dipeptidase